MIESNNRTEYFRQYREANRERLNEYHRKYNAANKLKRYKVLATYYKRTAERIENLEGNKNEENIDAEYDP